MSAPQWIATLLLWVVFLTAAAVLAQNPDLPLRLRPPAQRAQTEPNPYAYSHWRCSKAKDGTTVRFECLDGCGTTGDVAFVLSCTNCECGPEK